MQDTHPERVKGKYIAYFLAYTSIYDEYQALQVKCDEVIKDSDIMGLCVGMLPETCTGRRAGLICELPSSKTGYIARARVTNRE